MANEKILVDLILNDKDFQKGIKDAVKDTQKMGSEGKKSTQTLADGFKFMGAAIAAVGIKELISDLAKTAATTQAVESAFYKAFDNSDLKVLRNSVKGTVDDLSLMQRALKARDFGIPLKTMAAGLELAKIKAQETGQSVDFMVDSFVTGLGRKSVMILDNLNIKQSELSAEVERTGDFMEATANVVNRMLAESGGGISDLADDFGQINAELENIKGEIAKGLTPEISFLTKVLKVNLEAWGDWLGIIERASEEEEKHDGIVRGIVAGYEAGRYSLDDMNKALDTLAGKLEGTIPTEYGESLAYLNQKYDEWSDAIKEVNKLLDKQKIKTSGFGSNIVQEVSIRTAQPAQINTGTREVVQDMRLYNDELEKLGDQWGMFAEADVFRKIALETQAGIESAAAMGDQINKNNEAFTELDQTVMGFAETFTDGVIDAFAEAIIHGEDFGESMKKMIQSLIIEISKLAVKMAVLNLLFPGAGAAAAGGLGGILRFASGTNYAPGGMALVGEYGPELVNLPKGSSVYSSSKTSNMMGSTEIFGRLRGQDLLISNQRTRNFNAR